jgi:hypothetical protein
LEKRNFFVGIDRYLYFDFEDAMFFSDHESGKLYMKFVGDDFENEIADDHRIFNEAILRGIEITRAEYLAGVVSVSQVKSVS